MNNLAHAANKPDLYAPLHPAHPLGDVPGILAWLSGTAPKRRKPAVATASRLSLRQRLARGWHQPLRAGGLPRRWRWAAAAVVGASLTGALAALLSGPPPGLPSSPATVETPAASSNKRAAVPASAAPLAEAEAQGPARVETVPAALPLTAPPPSPRRTTAQAKAPAIGPAGSAGGSPTKQGEAPLPTPAAEPVDLDTRVIESILPHLPATAEPRLEVEGDGEAPR
jgi:hypothetical protein